MKIVIQNKENRLFWKGLSGWTSNLDEAHDFDTSTEAQKFCRDSQWNHVQVVVKFDSLSDIVLHGA